MAAALQSFIEIMGSGISSLATKIGTGLSDMAQAAFLEVNAETGAITGLSTFGGILAIFAGVSLAVGLTTLVVKWIMSLGARN